MFCDKLDKVNKDFLWGSTSEKRKLHLVGWSKIVKPKEDGGPGIQAAKTKDTALLAFENSIPNPSLPIECINQARKYHFCVSKAKIATAKFFIPVAWN